MFPPSSCGIMLPARCFKQVCCLVVSSMQHKGARARMLILDLAQYPVRVCVRMPACVSYYASHWLSPSQKASGETSSVLSHYCHYASHLTGADAHQPALRFAGLASSQHDKDCRREHNPPRQPDSGLTSPISSVLTPHASSLISVITLWR